MTSARVLAFLLAAAAAPPALAADAVDCAAPAEARAPDPRCGEPLDGRTPASAPAAVVVPRSVLWVPRLASRALFWPVVETAELVESNHVPDWIEAVTTSDDGKVGVRPIIHYTTSFLPTAGARGFYRRFDAPGAGVTASFQTAGPAVMVGDLGVSGPAWTGLALRAAWNHRIDRLYAGVGASTDAELAARGQGLARYGSDALLAEARWTRALPWRFSLGAHGDLQRRTYEATEVRGGPSVAEVYGTAQVPGFDSGLRVAHSGATLLWDARSRDRDGGGLSAMVDATYGRGVAGDPSRHVAISTEVVAALGGVDKVLLLRGRGASVRTVQGAPFVPFEELVMPGGALGMRGFADGRFRGQSGAVATAEYRWLIASNLDATLFTDVGTVADSVAGLGRARWFPDFGVGLRSFSVPGPHWEGDLQTGAQLAYAPDGGVRLLFSVAGF